MSDFSLTTLFVVPVAQTTLPTTGSTQDLTPGRLGVFNNVYAPLATTVAASPYFYIAQGRQNNVLQGSKRSDKIAGNGANVTEWYKVTGNGTTVNQITEVSAVTVKCGEDVTLTIRGFSSYLETLYFNGFTRSVTVKTPCCDCGVDPCTTVDASALVDQLIAKLNQTALGTNPDNISLSKFYTFSRTGTGDATKLVITGKPLTKYGNPCDVAAFPYEYDKLRFNVFINKGAATSADFLVSDACQKVATVTTTQESSYPKGVSEEIQELEKRYYSYQAGIMKHLFRMAGYNQNFESFVAPGTVYDTYYIKFNELAKDAYNWGDYIRQDSMVIIAVESRSEFGRVLEEVLESGLGVIV